MSDKVQNMGPEAAMATMLIWIPPELIALFKAIIESYDNLATLRTEDPALHHLRLYFAAESASEVNALIDSLEGQFSIRRIA
ncbi:MAG TPA: DUF4911 domain-containing protein [Candidatus Binataceae bacterium]|jgi:hypothetical protein